MPMRRKRSREFPYRPRPGRVGVAVPDSGWRHQRFHQPEEIFCEKLTKLNLQEHSERCQAQAR